jgi:hypothetical protein
VWTALLRNVNQDHNYWVELKLVGGPKRPCDASGAAVYLAAGGIRRRGDLLSSGSHFSSNDMRIHFGLGDTTGARTAEIHWSLGKKEFVRLPAVERIFTITYQQGITGALRAGKPCADPGESVITPGSATPMRCVRARSKDNFCSRSKTSRPPTNVVDMPSAGNQLKLLKSQAIENIYQSPI